MYMYILTDFLSLVNMHVHVRTWGKKYGWHARLGLLVPVLCAPGAGGGVLWGGDQGGDDAGGAQDGRGRSAQRQVQRCQVPYQDHDTHRPEVRAALLLMLTLLSVLVLCRLLSLHIHVHVHIDTGMAKLVRAIDMNVYIIYCCDNAFMDHEIGRRQKMNDLFEEYTFANGCQAKCTLSHVIHVHLVVYH